MFLPFSKLDYESIFLDRVIFNSLKVFSSFHYPRVSDSGRARERRSEARTAFWRQEGGRKKKKGAGEKKKRGKKKKKKKKKEKKKKKKKKKKRDA